MNLFLNFIICLSCCPIVLAQTETKIMSKSTGLQLKKDIDTRRAGELVETQGYKNLHSNIKISKIGTEIENKNCLKALSVLSANGLDGSEVLDLNKEQATLELDFSKNCLKPVNNNDYPQIASNVGRLHIENNDVICTVTLLNNDYAITARHCLFNVFENIVDQKSNFSYALKKNLKNSYIEFDGIGSKNRSIITAIWIKTDNEQKIWKKVIWDALDDIVTSDEKNLYQDYVVIQLDKSKKDIYNIVILNSKDNFNEGMPIHLLAYHPYYKLEEISGDSGIRSQKAGICQILIKSDLSCFAHGCSTLQKSSGAPIFFENKINDKSNFILMGIHVGARFDHDIEGSARCSWDASFKDSLNTAVSFTADDFKQFNFKE